MLYFSIDIDLITSQLRNAFFKYYMLRVLNIAEMELLYHKICAGNK